MSKQSPTFLCIETATKLCSVAVVCGGKIVAEKNEKSDQYIHAESLHPFIQEVFQNANVQPKEIDVIVVSKGPGSYTGLRIGVSATKGLAYALNKPVIAVNSLQAIAFAAAQAYPTYDMVAAVIDARRDEVYHNTYSVAEKAFSETEAIIVDDQFADRYQGKKVLIVGDASLKVAGLIPKQDTIDFKLDFEHKASNLYQLAIEKFKAQEFEDVAYFEPYYLKEFVAGKPKSQFKKA